MTNHVIPLKNLGVEAGSPPGCPMTPSLPRAGQPHGGSNMEGLETGPSKNVNTEGGLPKPMGVQEGRNIYTDGSYLAKTSGTWHLEDSPYKARQITRMLARHPEFRPDKVCEIGCGAGGILAALQNDLPGGVTFTGYEISPQAYALCSRFANANLNYVLGDGFTDSNMYDLVLVMDVIEHVEDCFSFLRKAKRKGRLKMYHIPLDTSIRAVLRGRNDWDGVGHIHLFTIETALKSVEYSGQRVLDWLLTDNALGQPNKTFRTRLANTLKAPLRILCEKCLARVVGGYSILVLAE